MLASAAPAASSIDPHRLPCRGSMLSGSIIYGYDYVAPDVSDACLRRMDGDQAPWESELHVAAMALAGAAWLKLVELYAKVLGGLGES
jgi:hypothetical protein